MTQKEFENLWGRLSIKIGETLLKKGNDYANKDRLDNFKNTAAICGVHPNTVSMSLMAVKINRLSNLITNNKKPENESIQDNALDLICYAILNYALIEDSIIDNQK